MWTIFKKIVLLSTVYILMQVLLMAVLRWHLGVDLVALEDQDQLMHSLDGNALRWMVTYNQLLGLLGPSLLFLFLYYGRSAFKVVRLALPVNDFSSLFALALMFSSYPLITYLAQLNQQIPLTEWMYDASEEIGGYMERIIELERSNALVINLLIVALIPAVSEEFFFRGMLQQELNCYLKKPQLAILLSALIFSAFHFQFEGFLPRLALGYLFGFAYHYSGSFFIPVLMHFTHNAVLVWSLQQKTGKWIENTDSGTLDINYGVLLISMIFVSYFIWLIRKQWYGRQKKETD